MAKKATSKTRIAITGSSPSSSVNAGLPPEHSIEELKNQNQYLTQRIQELEAMPAPQAVLDSTDEELNVVVIPYKHTAAAGKELLFALRAWAKNLDNVIIVIVGDKPAFISEEVIHISHTSKNANPQIDVAEKMALVIADDRVPEKFIWTNDDIFPLSPIHVADLELMTANGRLSATKDKVIGIYKENKERTLKLLKEAGLNNYDYATHTPVVFEKEKLAEIIAEYEAHKQGVLISTLYFNHFYPDHKPLIMDGGLHDPYVASVWRSDPSRAVLEKALKTRKFLNINDKGYATCLPYLNEMFGEKSEFEV